MSTQNSDTRVTLGPVSAYALAKAKGQYSGTETEFGQYLANAAAKAQETVASAQAAAASAVDASADALAAHGYAAQAAAAAQNAEDAAARSGYMNFVISNDGHLIYQHTESVDVSFSLVEGRLVASWQTD